MLCFQDKTFELRETLKTICTFFAGFYDRLVRLVRLGLPLKCNTSTNEKSESPTLLIKIKILKAVLIQALNLV